jgi:hypothetical protein
MFQQTIQDILAIAESSGRAQDVLECVRTRVAAFELFEGAELVAGTDSGPRVFVVSPGLGDAGKKALKALGEEPTLRVDTVTDLQSLGLSADPALASLLVLRVPLPGSKVGAIVLGHSRAWSFAGTPLFRVRTIGQVALRLLLPVAAQDAADPHLNEELNTLRAEVNRLRTHVATLEDEIAGPKTATGSRKRPGKQR